MARLQPVVRLSLRITIALLLLAHLLAAYALVAFGWRAGGFALNGVASYGYLVLTGLAAMLFVFTLTRNDEWAEASRIVLGPALALVVVGAWTGTTTNGAEYATWDAITGDQVPLQALWHLGFAGLGSLLALVLGWPRLLMAWALTHTLIFAAGLLVFGHWAYLMLFFNPGEALPLLAPLAYALAGLALGWRPRRKRASAKPVRPPTWLAFLPAALFSVAVARRWLSLEVLPRAGLAQPWVSSGHIVPAGAWSPALDRSATLFGVVPYLTLVVGVLGILSSWSDIRRARITPSAVLLWLGLAMLAGVCLSSKTPLFLVPIVVEGSASWLASVYGIAPGVPVERLLALALGGSGLMVMARWWAGARDEAGRRRARLAILGLLTLSAIGQLRSAWPYSRFLFWPSGDWQSLRAYAPVTPELLAWLGLGLHLILLALTIAVAAWWLAPRPPPTPILAAVGSVEKSSP